MSTLKVSTLQNLSGTEVYTCKAWVNFNGTGTVAIRASGNVSSITDNGTGNYTVNFTTAMPDANYVTCGSSGGSSQAVVFNKNSIAQTASAVFVIATIPGTSLNDDLQMQVAIFR
jgi:hypothetical protein